MRASLVGRRLARLVHDPPEHHPEIAQARFEQLTLNAGVSDPYFRYVQDNIRTGDY
ncbi:hypothetical protein JHN63_23210 [Streptomyces sp. MBT65]|uniref:hypothetical protein n=1 Tax=Streptomyces sp. MBT65 TaxID=1488395 RepID=UPI00190943F9|nr:hypothetical protein [Streptomyces sp. MBT65]MBK3576662.1 hypothetical protein [Streptomyces sp. MBT65]